MTATTLSRQQCPTSTNLHHQHDFGQGYKRSAERRTLLVTLLTIVTMFAEVIGGLITGSMALLADGIHMGGHAIALGLAFMAYYLARRYATDRRFTLGSGKINDLAAYTSALLLGLSSAWLIVESISRLLSLQPLLPKEAMAVAVVGLLVNLLSAWLLAEHHDHGHDHHHSHHDHHHHHHDDHHAHLHEHHGHDHNLHAALMHVLADAVTSVAAIIGLAAAWLWGWNWLDPVIALAASFVILRWAWQLLRQTGSILLDAEGPSELRQQIRQRLESIAGTQVKDLHLWSVGQGSWTLMASVVTHEQHSPDVYKEKLDSMKSLHHPIVEVYYCQVCGSEEVTPPRK
ncbi:MAG: CDF family Co(II)/Ni(II) efflux transporter DmeF [Gammaproteobacteria bacterium]|nr:CDF family Co(II)/Ni(II) efflux transporter DmeF [Gammaproteobacteria bacterium]MBU1723813.1 CDF family Co(II)/Ni(II) efflux transporter DmeF [Gammaproteobacteria bacterium]MBU2007006.1 CDF family Co(II)/Ni(II) efflux transporter DmeF [Gammaproteobacteria bacterium]